MPDSLFLYTYMDMQHWHGHVHRHAAQIWSCSMHLDNGHAACIWTMDMHGSRNANKKLSLASLVFRWFTTLSPASAWAVFAERAIVDYHLSFAQEGKHKSVFRFHLQREVCWTVMWPTKLVLFRYNRNWFRHYPKQDLCFGSFVLISKQFVLVFRYT